MEELPLLPGYWRADSETSAILKCPVPAACNGTIETEVGRVEGHAEFSGLDLAHVKRHPEMMELFKSRIAAEAAVNISAVANMAFG